ncbi:hypothetical protein AXW83_08725 [Bosea sp. PAMC 26642]|nr:hypothetical protein AXW83_08725 [Bosea sp. PAMC 26642]
MMSGVLAMAGAFQTGALAFEAPDCAACAPSDSARFKPSLLLALKNRSYVAEFAAKARAQGKPDAKLLHKTLVADVIVVPVEDRARISRFIAVGDGRTFGMSDKDVFDAAFKNLLNRATRVAVHDLGPVRALSFEADYNASLLLVRDVWSTVPDLPANLVVAVPARDIVAFGDGNDPDVLRRLRSIATMPTDGFPITRRLLRRIDGRWSVAE